MGETTEALAHGKQVEPSREAAIPSATQSSHTNTGHTSTRLIEQDCETLRNPTLHLHPRALPALSTLEKSGTYGHK